jgi:Holliday junction resolvase YEN1
LRLIALAIHPIFVFDGPNKPPFKRNKRTGPNVASIPEFLAKQLLKQFGYPIHPAPGEAEAECALLQREGIVDAVLSEDVDTLMFGSGITIRNWSPEKSGNTPTHVNVYDAVETKAGPSELDREGMILVALMSGGDYVPEGIPGCGPKTACEAAKAGFGHELCRIPTNDAIAMREWRDRLQHELKTNENKLFKRRHTTLKIPADFPRLDILGYYTHPAISSQAGLDKLRRSINWNQELDFSGLREFTNDAFDWTKLEGAKHFIRSLAPSMLVRQLRKRAEQIESLPTGNLQAIQEDEGLLVKGIHGKRQHPATDNSIELRVSFMPIELVKIDLSREEPDDEPDVPLPGLQMVGEADLDDEVALELEDDGPKKRGPTRFDPHKSARIWVMETFVKVGVPLKVQDWEAERQTKQKPRRAATVQEPRIAASKSMAGAKRTKTVEDKPQASIDRFAKVTKPGSKLSRALAKVQDAAPESQPASQQQTDVIDLLSSSPVRPQHPPPAHRAREKNVSPVFEELPPSVMKRRKRGPMQRSQTVPANAGTTLDRSTTPPVQDSIETLDLLSSPGLPSPSRLFDALDTRPKPLPTSRAARGISVVSPSVMTRQTTLGAWRASTTPTRHHTRGRESSAVPIPAPPVFMSEHGEIEELDLTLSPTLRPVVPQAKSRLPASQRPASQTIAVRPPLTSIPSNASSHSTSSKSSSSNRMKSTKDASTAIRSRRTSPRLRKTKSPSPELETLDLTSPQLLPVKAASPEIDSIDLTLLSSPAPIPASVSPPPMQTTMRRSPRNHVSLSPEPVVRKSPPAAWKKRAEKKRQIVLRESVAGGWRFAEVESAEKGGKEKERKKWRESEVELLDLS